MKWSPSRFWFCNLGLTVIAVVVAWLLVGHLWPHSIAGPGELLPPTGTLLVGRASYHWVDGFPQAPAPEASPKREIMVHIWYPAKPSKTDRPAPYISGFATMQAAVGVDELRDAAGASYEALSSARTHAVADAPISPETAKYPVLLLTHGLRFNSLGYTMLGEDLASHGYIVVGIDHPATAFAVLYPDHRVALFDESLWTKHRTPEETREFEHQRVEGCAADLVFALNQLEQLESGAVSSPFQGRLDLSRIGVFGHSFGGRVAARACQLESRIKAGIVCDGFGRNMTIEKNPDGCTIEQPMMIQYARRVPLHGWARTQALMQTPGAT